MSYRFWKNIAVWGSVLFVILAVFYAYQQWTIYTSYPRDIAARLGLNERNLIHQYRFVYDMDIFQERPVYVMIFNKDISPEEFKKDVERVGLSDLEYGEGGNYTLTGLSFGGALEVNGSDVWSFYQNTQRGPKPYTWWCKNGQEEITISLYAVKEENDMYTLDGKSVEGNILILSKK